MRSVSGSIEPAATKASHVAFPIAPRPPSLPKRPDYILLARSRIAVFPYISVEAHQAQFLLGEAGFA
jgi:hypothetical protein